MWLEQCMRERGGEGREGMGQVMPGPVEDLGFNLELGALEGYGRGGGH